MTFYAKIAEPVVDDLTPYAGWLYTVLVRLIPRQLNQLRITRDDLAAAAHMSVRSVVRYTKALEEKGLIAVQRLQKPGQRTAEINVYSLAGVYAEVALSGGQTGTGGRASEAQGGGTDRHGLNPKQKTQPVGGGVDSSSSPGIEVPQVLKDFYQADKKSDTWIRELCEANGFDYAVQVVEYTKKNTKTDWGGGWIKFPVAYATKAIRLKLLDFERSSWKEAHTSPYTLPASLFGEQKDFTKETDDDPHAESAAPPGWPPMFWPEPDDVPIHDPSQEDETEPDDVDATPEADEASEVREVMR